MKQSKNTSKTNYNIDEQNAKKFKYDIDEN